MFKIDSEKELLSFLRILSEESVKKSKDSLNEKLPKNDLAIEPKGKKGIVVNNFYS